ncbi:3136_t:CDS:1, partial [Paraglomus occultum]
PEYTPNTNFIWQEFDQTIQSNNEDGTSDISGFSEDVSDIKNNLGSYQIIPHGANNPV